MFIRGWILLIIPLHVLMVNSQDEDDGGPFGLTEPFTYDRIDLWGASYPACNGNAQSPIDIIESDAVPDPFLNTQPWQLINYTRPIDLTMSHTGHSMTLGSGPGLLLTGAGFRDTYIFRGFHYHWGPTNRAGGSEHRLNGMQYPGEIHFVHTNSKYSDFSDTLINPDGFNVFCVFVAIGAYNPVMDPIIDQLSNIPFPDSTPVQISLSSIQVFLPNDLSEYYRYQGSMTGPPCFEVVTWNVFKTPFIMSAAQFNSFRTMLYNMRPDASSPDQPELITSFFRTPNPINSRRVKYVKINHARFPRRPSSAEVGTRGATILVVISFLATRLFDLKYVC